MRSWRELLCHDQQRQALNAAACAQYKVDEVQRCTEAVPGKAYKLEACVVTTATYGDKFRPVILHTCAHELLQQGAGQLLTPNVQDDSRGAQQVPLGGGPGLCLCGLCQRDPEGSHRARWVDKHL